MKTNKQIALQLCQELGGGFPPEELDKVAEFLAMLIEGYDYRELYEIIDRHPEIGAAGCICAYIGCRRSGADDRRAKLALRVGLSMEDGKHEYFNADDLAAATGVDAEAAKRTIQSSPDRMTVSLAPWLQG